MKFKTFLILTALISFILPVVYAATEVFTVPPGSWKSYKFTLADGDTFECSISVKGGSGNDVDIEIRNPRGELIRSSSRVVEKSFKFIATEYGGYTIKFDNTFSFISGKTVTFTYSIEEAPEPGIFQGIPGFPIISIVIGFVIVFLIFRLYSPDPSVIART